MNCPDNKRHYVRIDIGGPNRAPRPEPQRPSRAALCVKQGPQEDRSSWVSRQWHSEMTLDGNVKQCMEAFEEASQRWVHPFPMIPETWTPPENFCLSWDHWLIPKRFIQEGESTQTTTPADVQMISFHEWRARNRVDVRIGGPAYLELSIHVVKKHFPLCHACNYRQKRPSHLEVWPPDIVKNG